MPARCFLMTVSETMNEFFVPKVEQKKDWTLTQSALHRLLAWLDEDADSDGRKYLEMRRRLVAYFDRKNCSAPEELSDETLNRVARRLEEQGAIECETPAKYCYIVARYVFMEHLREAQKDKALRDDVGRQPRGNDYAGFDVDDEKEIKEKMLHCLEQCAGKLESAHREIIFRYYIGKERIKIENRRALAAELGITINALSIRACRIREKLEVCVRECVGAK